MKKQLIGLAAAALLTFGGAAFAEALDINQAGAEELAATIDGVGTVKAAAIIEHREKHGDFQSVDDLQAVDGIGPKTVEKNRDALTVAAE